jgi:uncharacterized repeat protein (TIGR01451 family)
MKLFQSLFYQQVLLTTLGLLTISPPVLADLQTSENYVLSATVLSNGSGEANSSEYSLTATVGTPFAETAAESQSLLSSLLQLQTTSEVKEVGQGQQHITYTVTITNLGTETATGIIFTDIIPAGTELLTIHADSSGKANFSGKDCDKKTASCKWPDLAPNASIQVELVVQNKLGEAPANTAQVKADNYPASVDVIPVVPVVIPPEEPPPVTTTVEPTPVTTTVEPTPVTTTVEPTPVTTTVEPTPVTTTVEPTPVTTTVEPIPVTTTVEPIPVTTTVEPTPVTTTVEPTPVTTTVEPTPVTTTVEPIPVTTTPVPVTPAEEVTPTVTPPPVVSTTVVPPTPPVVFLPAVMACPTEGDVEAACNAYSQTIKVEKILPSGQISNGVLETTLTNQGWVSNLTITTTGKLIGGTVTGYIKNQGVMLDFEFQGMSIIGGSLGGTLQNTSRVGGFFQDVTFLANTHLTGGYLKGTIKGDKNAPAILEQVRVKSGSHLSGVKLGKGVKLEKGVVVEKE